MALKKLFIVVFIMLLQFNGCTSFERYKFLSCNCEEHSFFNEKIKLSMEAIYFLSENNFLTSRFAIRIENYASDTINIDYTKIKLSSDNFIHELTSSFIEKKAGNLSIISFDFEGKYKKPIQNLENDQMKEEVVSLFLEGIFLGDEELKLDEIKMTTQEFN